MRLSAFHMELAKRIAQGQPNREIMKEVKISGSRLSVLKANSVFNKAVKKYEAMEEDKYRGAIKVFGDKAEEIAKEITRVAVSPLTQPNDKIVIVEKILDRLAQTSDAGGNSGNGGGEEMTFEQTLKITKRVDAKGDELEDVEQNPSIEADFEELKEDLVIEGMSIKEKLASMQNGT